MRHSLVFGSFVTVTLATALAAAQPAPSGAHPRLWLDAETRTALEAQSAIPGSPVARGAERCALARQNPERYATGGWQGFEFVLTLSSCLVAWVASEEPEQLETAIKYWNVLLDDYRSVGDGLGGDDVVTHDAGYAVRTFAPYSALAYDWLHDAPGVTEELRERSRRRFDAWFSYYRTSGYLRNQPGANYQAGYLFAATLMAIAEAGESGTAGDAHWAAVRDEIWGTDMARALAPGAVLDGGDWPEGWQYGSLSVLEYALGARAMQDSGVAIPNAASWADSLVTRFAHGLTPALRMYTAGDTQDETANRAPVNGALLAAMAGPASDAARAWAHAQNASLGLEDENPLFDALALSRSQAAATPEQVPTHYLAPGTGNFYARGAWTADTAWAVFQCTRRLVADHQHNNAGNWVMSRGADDLVVDPSPYNALSTLTGNAPAIDSAVLPAGYSPSQADWGKSTRLVWAEQTRSGVAVARCDYADQFRFRDVESDVPHAVRDFLFVPDGDAGTVVLVDRAVTGNPSRALHLRVRTQAELVMSGDEATATLGDSTLSIRRLWASSGQPNVRDLARASECPSSSIRSCDVSRLGGREFRLDVAGPEAGAIHVVEGRATSRPGTPATMFEGAGHRGVYVPRGRDAVAVVTSAALDGSPGTSLTYRVPASGEVSHVVLDAPANAEGRAEVIARRDGSDCEVTVTPAESDSGHPGRPLLLRTTSSCELEGDATAPAGGPDDRSGTGGNTAGSGGSQGDGVAEPDDDGGGGEHDGGQGGTSGAGRTGATPASGSRAGAGSPGSIEDGSTNAGASASPTDASCSQRPVARQETKLGVLGWVVALMVGRLRRRERRSPASEHCAR